MIPVQAILENIGIAQLRTNCKFILSKAVDYAITIKINTRYLTYYVQDGFFSNTLDYVLLIPQK